MRFIGIKLALVFVLIVFALVSCGESLSDEDRIKMIIRDAAAAAEKKDASGVMKYLSKDFTGGQADVDYDAIKAFLLHEMLRPGNVRVVITRLEVDVKKSGSERTGLASAAFVAARGRPKAGTKELLPDSVGGYRASLVLKHDGKDWKVVHAEWVDVGPAAL